MRGAQLTLSTPFFYACEMQLELIREEGNTYDRETWFRQEPYFRYFRKFKKTSPVMMQVEEYVKVLAPGAQTMLHA